MKHLLFGFFFLWGGSLLAQSTITPEIIADLQTVGQTVISPDGKTVAYTLRVPGSADDKPGTSWSEIYTVSLEGEYFPLPASKSRKNKSPQPTQVSKRYLSQPQSGYSLSWSPDGKFIYFLSHRKEIDAHTQVYRISIDGGEAEQVTGHENGITGYHLAPDGKQIAFLSRDVSSRQEKIDASLGKDWIVYGEQYKYARLYLQATNSANSRLVFENDLEVTGFCWHPAGNTLVFKAAEKPETDDRYMFQKIYQVKTSGGSPRIVCKTEGKLGPIAVSPSGTLLAYTGAVDLSDPLAQSLFVAELKSGNPRNLTEGLEASSLGFSWESNTHILLHCAEGTRNSLYRQPVSGKARQSVFAGGAIFRSFSFHPSSGVLAVPGHTPNHPRELMVGLIADLSLQRMTFSNPGLDNVALGRQESIAWKGPDELMIEGIVTYPPNYKAGQAYPLLLQIHGGPEGVSSNGWNTRAVYPIQWYAAKGFVVLEPNYRGSQGRGVAFAKADQGDLAGKEFEDVLAGIDYLATQGIIDPEKVATGGFSYGGYFSAWAATKHSQKFRAAMVGAGITNWISFSGTTDIIYENSLVHWNLWWYDHMELVWDRSPLAHLRNADTPTLIVHGERDLRVPTGQGQELYHGLKLRNIPTEMVIYRRQPHGIRERAAQLDYMNRTANWYIKYTF